MPKKLSKEVTEVRFLYTGVVLLLIIALVLVLVLFLIPSSPFRKKANQSRPPIDAENVHTLLDAPSDNQPVRIPPALQKNLDGRKERVVPTHGVMDMLSAPPPQK